LWELIDRRASGRYYISAKNMNNNYLDNYGPLLLMFVIAAGLASALIMASEFVGHHKRTKAKDQPYECGMIPTGDARERFSVHFYMVALLFILFDIEAIFLYPWALVYHDLKVFGFVEMLLYIAILFVGYIYLWKKGALDWYS
jgi:NADH-quinone oxidoreductase subunit A